MSGSVRLVAGRGPGRPRRRALRRGALLVAVLGLVGWVLLGSGRADVDAFEVRGTDDAGVLGPADVRAAAADQRGRPLLLADTGGVADRLEADPRVLEARVSRSWPDVLVLDVRVRTPVAVTRTGAGVGADGVVLPADVDVPDDLARLDVADPGPEDDATRDALAVLAGLPGDLRADVVAVGTAAAGVDLELDDGTTVSWGRPGPADARVVAVRALRAQHPGAHLDVAADGVAVVRSGPRPGVGAPPAGRA